MESSASSYQEDPLPAEAAPASASATTGGDIGLGGGECPICFSTFRSNLRRHIRSHTGFKPFRCFLCDFASAQKGNLKLHCAGKHQMTSAEFDRRAEIEFKNIPT